ncbi:MAG: ATP cone domain-containing protein, partial [bacterium]|nr:ATP cone domain-containing protein [bacterium]
MKYIEKRNGDIVPFDRQKIMAAIEKAAGAIERMEPVDAEQVNIQVLKLLKGLEKKPVTSVEEIQDLVE